MSPILNPTAPAFSPPVSIPRLASPFISTSVPVGVTSELDLEFDSDLDLALDADLPGSELSTSETSQVAISLLGESLLKAVFQSPSSPYSPIDENDEFDDIFMPSPPTTTSTPISCRDIWSPTAVSSSASEGLSSPFSSVLSLSDEEMCHSSARLPTSQDESWGSGYDWSNDDDVVYGQRMTYQPINLAPAVPESPLKFGKGTNLPSPVFSNMQPQLLSQQLAATHLQHGFMGFNPQLQSLPLIAPSLQLIQVPPVSAPRIGLAPLWPLLSALQRNLSRSRPDLYGNLQPPAYFGLAS